MEEPRQKQSRILRLDPILQHPNIDSEDPNRKKFLIDRLLPRLTQSSILRLLPRRLKPYMDIAEPNFATERRLKDDPKLTISSVDNEDPM
jgi:hypothetical protein